MAAAPCRRIACRRPLYNTRGERGSRGKSKVSPVLHVHGFHQVHSTFPPVGRAHCAMPILRAKNVGQVGLVGLVGRLAHGAVSAMCFCIFIAHGCVVCWLAWHIACHGVAQRRRAHSRYRGQNFPVQTLTRGRKGVTGEKRFPPCSMCMAFTKEQSAFPLAGKALCAMPILRAENGNTGNTGNAIFLRSFRGGHVLRHFQGTWLSQWPSALLQYS